MLIYFEQREKRGSHRQKVYAGTFTSQVGEAVDQPIEQAYMYVQTWELEELYLPSDYTESASKDGKKLKVLRYSERAT